MLRPSEVRSLEPCLFSLGVRGLVAEGHLPLDLCVFLGGSFYVRSLQTCHLLSRAVRY